MNRIVDRYYNKIQAEYSKYLQYVIQSGDPDKAYNYAKNYKKIIPELEDIIGTSTSASHLYTEVVLLPLNIYVFEKGEEALSKEADTAYYYALDMIAGRWEKGEDAISKAPNYSYWYAKNVLKGRFEKGEDTISKDQYYSYYYALDVLKGREKVDLSIKPVIAIMSSVVYILNYVQHLKDIKDKEGLSDEDISNFTKQADYMQGLEKYMEVPEIEDIDEDSTDIKPEENK